MGKMRRGGKEEPARAPRDRAWEFAPDPDHPGQTMVRNHFCSWCGEFTHGPHVGTSQRVAIHQDEQGRRYHHLHAVGRDKLYYNDRPGDVAEAESKGYYNNNYSGGVCKSCAREQLEASRRRRQEAQAAQAAPPPPPPEPAPEATPSTDGDTSR